MFCFFRSFLERKRSSQFLFTLSTKDVVLKRKLCHSQSCTPRRAHIHDHELYHSTFNALSVKKIFSISRLNKESFLETWCTLRFGALNVHFCAIHKEAIFVMLQAKEKIACIANCLVFGPLESVNSVCVLCLQCVPGGGGGGTSTQSTRNSRNPALLPSSHSLPKRHAPKLPVLLHCSVPRRRHPLAAALHCGRQQDLQRLLECPSAASEKLQHLLPGCQHSQRGGCFGSFYFYSCNFSLSSTKATFQMKHF